MSMAVLGHHTLARHELHDPRGVQNTRTKIYEALARVSYLYMFNLCPRYFAQWRLFVSSCENVATSACIGSFVQACLHRFFGSYRSQDTY